MPVVTMPHLTQCLISLQNQLGLLERCFRWGVQTGAHEGAGTRLKRHGCCADKFLDNVLEENPKLLIKVHGSEVTKTESEKWRKLKDDEAEMPWTPEHI